MELFHIEPEMASLLNDTFDKDLCSLPQLQEDPANDAQNEFFIYTCFLIFTRRGSMEYLERAIQRAEGWVAESANDHPDRSRRLEILDKLTARIREHRNMPEDIDPPSDGTERSVPISLELVPGQIIMTDRKVHPKLLNGGGSHLQKFDY